MPGIPLQTGIVYGPVLSRRLGRSLGINLSPVDRKVCSFDCVYCQYGERAALNTLPSRKLLPSIDEVLSAVEKAFRKPRTFQFVTFSGNGEPTLHPDFPEIVREVSKLKDRIRPEVQLATLSNSSRINDPQVLSALSLMDAPMMKLDAGDEKTFRLINRPAPGVEFASIIDGLKQLPNLMIQSMLINGGISNIRGDAYDAWVDALSALQPKQVHIYSIERPTAKGNIKNVPAKVLERIKGDLLRRTGLDVRAFWRN